MKKAVKLIIMLSLLSLILIGCSKKSDSDNKETNNSKETTSDESNSDSTKDASANETKSTAKTTSSDAKGTGLQFESPKKGDTIAELVVKDYGTISLRFFPDQAPKAVENFITHAKKGYYNGLTFHRIISDFMIQGGDPTGTGMGGESIWGKAFEDEFSDDLSPYRGALCMANSGANTNGSQFFIVQANAATVTQDVVDWSEEQTGKTFTKEQLNNYFNVGGTPWLYTKHTVFGQMYDGFDVLDKIAAVATDANGMPTDKVIIEKINIKKLK
ncbi:complement regulator-acquiring protein [Anaeromicropila herbilytica]|uniref:Peptidyl-prolyl cis-trans isomerase n=1 Tax=Anaeromicropila herbilytica TaxID=2785025 RepID=A0A7R7ICY3_9FIRM|nr:complement regulator-acquiring protein [Anaeromicropila herbilytica]BCN30439.1 hypothetical protein bsdtb5_17340 [Anaeromicropila herbilytica]